MQQLFEHIIRHDDITTLRDALIDYPDFVHGKALARMIRGHNRQCLLFAHQYLSASSSLPKLSTLKLNLESLKYLATLPEWRDVVVDYVRDSVSQRSPDDLVDILMIVDPSRVTLWEVIWELQSDLLIRAAQRKGITQPCCSVL